MDDALADYYALDRERDRLTLPSGRIEFERTIEIVLRSLPPAPAVVADIGGGPGRYTDWLLDLGYTVVHRDVIDHHVEQVRSRHGARVDTAVGDARSLDLADASVDAMLCLGPLYHLSPQDRPVALAEALRVVRPGAMVYFAAISRWASRIDGILTKRVHRLVPEVLELIDEVERTGYLPPPIPGGFTSYTHRPEELRTEVSEAGFEIDALVSVESVGACFDDAGERLDDPAERAILLDALRALEAVPELLGVGPHLLAVARRPVPTAMDQPRS